MAEILGATEPDSRERRQYTLGAYYQPLDNLKVGAFVSRSFGLRHDDDWVKNGGTWEWQATNDRGEDCFILDVSPRVQFAENIVGELKSRYLYNTFNSYKTLMVRPGVTYFWLKDEKPFLSFFAQVEFDFGLNYGPRAIAEDWGYVGALYRIAKSLDLGATYSMRWQTWGSSADYLAKNGDPYVVTETNGFFGGTLIYQFGF